MQCLMVYKWVKLMRSHLTKGEGIMGYWAKLASHAAFRKGQALYCGYLNDVAPGMWSGGMVGLKRILGLRSRRTVLDVMNNLSDFGFINYTIDPTTKKLEYFLNDWIENCSGESCLGMTAYAIDEYGFLCLPRNITDRLVECRYTFEEADAWLDLWCHSVFNDPKNAFSFLAPTIQYGKYGAILTLETLGQRWGWEKTKVWRFLKKHGDVFDLCRLPGNYGCVLFNKLYPTGAVGLFPTQEQVEWVFTELRSFSEHANEKESTRVYLNRLVAWYSKRISERMRKSDNVETDENRVALSTTIIRAYLSLCWNCKNYRYDCKSIEIYCQGRSVPIIRGPCRFRHKKETGEFTYGKPKRDVSKNRQNRYVHRGSHPIPDAKRNYRGSEDRRRETSRDQKAADKERIP